MLSAEDEKEIRGLFDRVKQSWNQTGTVPFEDLYTADSDYVTFSGQHLVGRTANQQLHENLWRGVLRGATLHGEVTQVRPLGPDVAVMHATGNLQLRFHKRPKPNRDSIQTFVVVRTAEGWRVSAFHNTRIQKPGVMEKLFTRLFS